MCDHCGCGQPEQDYEHKTVSHRHPPAGKTILLEQNVLAANNQIAQENRLWFDRRKVRVLNMISSPGAGKTTLIERTLEHFQNKKQIAVITGDLQTDNDAQRLRRLSDRIKQINTIHGCHLDASMIQRETESFVDEATDLLIIENVGNLVCPAVFDLGEHETIALLSTTEGEDKPVKYPVLFHKADTVVITKMDLIPYLDWDEKACADNLSRVRAHGRVIRLSAKSGEGLDSWFTFLTERSQAWIS